MRTALQRAKTRASGQHGVQQRAAPVAVVEAARLAELLEDLAHGLGAGGEPSRTSAVVGQESSSNAGSEILK